MVVFDLDDTLYKEQDYLLSAYREIASLAESRHGAPQGVFHRMLCWRQEGANVFRQLIDTYGLTLSVDDLLAVYRSHRPAIRLDEATSSLLGCLRQHSVLGVITDGRSVTQRHKAEALRLTDYMDARDILISEETGYEKPSEEPFRQFMARYPAGCYYYIGDNPAKDFLAPGRLGWTTVCLLDDGRNIHRQDFSLPTAMLPQYRVSQLAEIEHIVNEN